MIGLNLILNKEIMKIIYMLPTIHMMHFENQEEANAFIKPFEQKQTKNGLVYFTIDNQDEIDLK